MTLAKLNRLDLVNNLGSLWELALYSFINELQLIAHRRLARFCIKSDLLSLPLGLQGFILRLDVLAESKLVVTGTAPDIHVIVLIKGR